MAELKIYKPNSELSKYYSFIFKLPSKYTVLLLTLIVNIIIYIISGQLVLYYIMYYAVVLSIVWIYGLIIDSPYKRVKRSLALAMITEIYAFIIGMINIGLGIASSTVFIILGILGIDGTSVGRYILSIIPPATALLILNMYDYIPLLIVPVVLDYFIYKVMSVHKVDKYPAPELGSMFLRNILEKKRDIEKVFDDLSSEEIVHPRIIFGDNKLFLLYSDIHYGPFSNTGSSMLPSLIHNKLNDRYESVVVLHGMGSHDRNLPTLEETERFVERIINSLSENSEQLKFYGFDRISDEEWDLLLVVLDKLSIIFISRNDGIDDLPYELQVEYELKARQLGLGDLILVDCHNHELESKPNITNLKKLLDTAISRINEIKKGIDGKEGTIIYRTKTVEARSPGVIGSKITILQLGKDPKNLVTLIYIPGNNMEPGLRNKIRSILNGKYNIDIRSIEVFTSDEHTETGIRSSTIYIPVLSTDKLLEAIVNGYQRLLNEEFETDLRYMKLDIKVKLMKDSAWKLLELVRKSFKISFILILTYIILIPFILYLIKLIQLSNIFPAI